MQQYYSKDHTLNIYFGVYNPIYTAHYTSVHIFIKDNFKEGKSLKPGLIKQGKQMENKSSNSNLVQAFSDKQPKLSKHTQHTDK